MSQKNPFKKGKSKLVAQFILEGKTNEDIYAFIKENNLDKQYKNPLTKKAITNVRWTMKSEGHLGEDGFPINQDDPKPKSSSIEEENGNNQDNQEDSKKTKVIKEVFIEDSKKKVLVQRRPDWDLLCIEQVNEISDPQMRQKILDYKTFWEKAKQEVNPDYATSEQFEGFKAEIQESLGTIVETLNERARTNGMKIHV